jgi:hypothetical protein
MADYQAQYAELNAQYVQLIQEILANPAASEDKIPQVTALAGKIAALLDSAAKDLAMVPNPSNDLAAERDELVKRLQRIQQDYSGLLQNTDKVETLRRIRSYQDESWRPTFTFHLIAFFVLAITVFLVVLFLRQRENTATNPMAATMRPSFTY